MGCWPQRYTCMGLVLSSVPQGPRTAAGQAHYQMASRRHLWASIIIFSVLRILYVWQFEIFNCLVDCGRISFIRSFWTIYPKTRSPARISGTKDVIVFWNEMFWETRRFGTPINPLYYHHALDLIKWLILAGPNDKGEESLRRLRGIVSKFCDRRMSRVDM